MERLSPNRIHVPTSTTDWAIDVSMGFPVTITIIALDLICAHNAFLLVLGAPVDGKLSWLDRRAVRGKLYLCASTALYLAAKLAVWILVDYIKVLKGRSSPCLQVLVGRQGTVDGSSEPNRANGRARDGYGR
jgi:hypothetical protein